MKHRLLPAKALVCACTILALHLTLHAQIQIGQDIDGLEDYDGAGACVSMPDVNTVAIGAPGNDTNGASSGQVRIYTWSGNTWLQKGQSISGEAAYDGSGEVVSMPDPNTVAIGAQANDGNGNASGHVRIYAWNGNAWVQKGADIDGEAVDDASGVAVAMPDANTVAIGAEDNDGGGNGRGQVRIYAWNGTAWVQKGMDIDGEGDYDRLGCAVTMPDANTVGIGASNNDGNGVNAGHVRIYHWNGNAWVQKGDDIDGEAEQDYSGRSVSMPNPHTVAIGADFNDGNGAYSGQVRIYAWNGTAWVQKGTDIDGEAANNRAGRAVSMPNANTVGIGAYGNDGNGNHGGHVRIYGWNGSAWVQKGVDIDGETQGENSGWSVSMPGASTVAVGAPFNNGAFNNQGHVRVYSLCPSSTGSISPIACNQYTSPSGSHTWTSSGTYLDILPNAAGCDSVITVQLTIHTADVSVTNASPTLTANATNASYQWLDCNQAMAAIPGETHPSFTAVSNGSYAVAVTQNGCTDTSACQAVTAITINEHVGSDWVVYPNPTEGKLRLDLGSPSANVFLKVSDVMGRVVLQKTFDNTSEIQFQLSGEVGMYFLEVATDSQNATFKVIKK